MVRGFLCFVTLLISLPVFAQETEIPDPLALPEETVAEEVLQQKVLPKCDDALFIERVKTMLAEYNAEHPARSIYEKRKQLLQMRFAQSYEEKPASDFVSADNRVIADRLLMTKINNGLKDEDVRVCVSRSENSSFQPVYILLHPNRANETEFHIINYAENPENDLSAVWEE